MNHEEVSSRLRWLAIAAGLTSAVAFYPSGFLFIYPILLFGGGILAPRLNRPGRWLMWIGAIGTDCILLQYNIIAFHRVRFGNGTILSTFLILMSLSTLLATWCSIELIVDDLIYMHLQSAQPISCFERTFRWIINCWALYSIVASLITYKHSGDSHVFWAASIPVLVALLLDLSTIKKVIRSS